jgi:hypothetical protein
VRRRATLALLLGALLAAGYAQASEPPLIDPDCYPEWAEQADPALLEEPDEVCPPGSPEPPKEGGGAKPGGDGAKPDAPAGADPAAPGEEPAPPPGSGPLPAGDRPPAGDPRPAAPASPEPTDRLATGSPQKPDRPERGEKRRPPAKKREPARPRRDHARPRRDHARQRRDHARQRRDHARPRRDDARARRDDARPRRDDARPRRDDARTRRDGARPRRAPAGKRVAKGAPRVSLPRVPAPRFLVSAQAETLPDPIPPARRLDRRFAERLGRVSQRTRVPWELMLAVLRVRGHDGPVPADRARLRALARRLAELRARRDPRRAVRRLERGRRFVQRVVALAHYNRAVRLAGLVRGLRATRKLLARRVLDHHRLAIYAGGREDIRSGFTDVRVLVLLLYLSSRSSEVTVTSLTSGHSYLTASGNVSLHSHGRAVDIAAIGGRPILGNQEPGGLTDRTLHRILLMPKRFRPTELISLFDLGGPAFAQADHADHIHVGY